jgi:hypothetical protein
MNEHPLRFAVRAVDRFFFTPTEPTTLGLIRIATGLIVLYVHLVYSIGLNDYLGPTAWVANTGLGDHLKPGEGGVTEYLRKENVMLGPSTNWYDNDIERGNGQLIHGQTMWSIYYHVEDPFWIRVLHNSFLVILFLFTIGLWTRVTSALAWMGALMYINRLQGQLFGMDTMTNLALFYLMIAPCGAALSVDRWLHVRRQRQSQGAAYVPKPPEPLPSACFATRLLQINFCLIYGAAGVSKLLGSTWWNGTAPNRFLLNYSFAPFDVDFYVLMLKYLAAHRWLWEVVGSLGVVFTLVLELGFPFLIWNRYTRWVMVCGVVLFHTQIALLMGLVMFSLMMMTLVLAFVPPQYVRQTLQGWGEVLQQLLFGRKSPVASAQPAAAAEAKPEAASQPGETVALS